MKFDIVFDIQKTFRKAVEAFSYPGTIISLKEESAGLDLDWNCYDASKLLMYLLLDADTSFAMAAEDQRLGIQFSKMTYCPMVSIEQASYIFVNAKHTTSLQEIIKAAKIGTLEDPQTNATLIIECEKLNSEKQYRLKGPGIKDEKEVGILLQEEWLEARNDKNVEFPLGIDLIFVDANGNLMALPRTTQIERRSEWHM